VKGKTLTIIQKSRPFILYVLVTILILQVIGALYGGISLVIDPSGKLLQMPAGEWLKGTPFADFLIPGIILSILLGVYPGLIIYGLLRRVSWKWAEAVNLHKEQYWANTHALYLGIMLIIWIDVQVYFIGYGHFIQTIYALKGLLITILALWPSIRGYYRQ